MFEGGIPRQASIKVGEFVETLTNRTVTKQQEKPMFKKLMMFLKTDNGLRDAMPDMLDYVDAIQITKTENVEDDGRPYNIEDEGLRETCNTTVDGRIIQTLIHRATPLTPNINVIFLFGSFLRMDEINQTPRAGTALRNHNIEIRGR